ncbi:MAG: nucleotide exchange factor GrpE [Lachnospiraceae bacterium]|nr:nucleotide exchange factor GrpE [Lachnospiraceae bacterium]MDD6504288.1 nucleotide exchange factor GrpE [Lachnospiraceae bacterium]
MEESVEENLDDVEETQAAEDAQEKEARDVTESEDTSEGSQADGAEAAEDAQEKAAEGKKKEGPFKKKKDKRDEQIEELNDRLKRQMAEFENFRKRTEKEKSQMFDMGARTIVEKILPVVDNFERGLAAVPEEQKEDAFVSGMDKVYKQLMTELETIGVTPIECVGQEFNPDYHNAVMQVENEELEAGTVAQELLKGYMYKDTVVRHSMVSVVS